ncbi:MAG: SGNH/GDSL hydrolase family protein [Bacteroidota bacterium]
MNWETYVAYGDSITIGARTYFGYPEWTGDLLAKRLDKRWQVVNHAVSGYTTIDLARHIDAHYARLQTHEASLSTIMIGTNDVKIGTPLADYELALRQVILKVLLLTPGRKLILLHIPPLQQGIMYPYQFAMNETIKIYNQTIVQLSEEYGLSHHALPLDEPHFLDGVHLNRSGVEQAGASIAALVLRERGIV